MDYPTPVVVRSDTGAGLRAERSQRNPAATRASCGRRRMAFPSKPFRPLRKPRTTIYGSGPPAACCGSTERGSPSSTTATRRSCTKTASSHCSLRAMAACGSAPRAAALRATQNGKFRSYGAEDGLSDGFVRALYEDRGGTIWVGTDNGLLRFANGRLVRVDGIGNVPPLAVHAIAEDHRGGLWVGGSRLLRLDAGQVREYTLQGGRQPESREIHPRNTRWHRMGRHSLRPSSHASRRAQLRASCGHHADGSRAPADFRRNRCGSAPSARAFAAWWART